MSSLSAKDRGGRARARWFDVRLAIGIVLVGASIAGVVAIVASADRAVTVYAAGSTLAVGDVITADDLVETDVRLGPATGSYLAPATLPGDGVVITRTVGAGELVPVTAVGESRSDDWASVVITVAGTLPRSVGSGTLVDLWAASARDSDTAPGIVAAEVTVVRVADDEGMIAGTAVLSVELLVPRDRVARILQSKAAGDALSLVPAAVPLGG